MLEIYRVYRNILLLKWKFKDKILKMFACLFLWYYRSIAHTYPIT